MLRPWAPGAVAGTKQQRTRAEIGQRRGEAQSPHVPDLLDLQVAGVEAPHVREQQWWTGGLGRRSRWRRFEPLDPLGHGTGGGFDLGVKVGCQSAILADGWMGA